MITFVTGNLLDELGKSEAIVNTVNIVGVMGKGIALQFKNRFPENFEVYKKACDEKQLTVGKMLVFQIGEKETKYIINFPTKTHWKYPSKMEYVEKGLNDLISVIKKKKIKSIAIPALGCGNGKLNWDEVKPLIESKLAEFEDVNIKVFEPSKSIVSSKTGKKVEKKPRLSKERKLLLLVLDTYNRASHIEKATHTEANNLAYLIGAYNEDLKLKFELKKYGPFSKGVNDVLAKLNNHYIFVKRREGQASTIESINTKFPQVKSLEKDKTLINIKRLIKGFEDENSLMVLVTAHWFYYKEDDNIDNLFSSVRQWCNEYDHPISDDLIKKCVDRLSQACPKSENLSLDI